MPPRAARWSAAATRPPGCAVSCSRRVRTCERRRGAPGRNAGCPYRAARRRVAGAAHGLPAAAARRDLPRQPGLALPRGMRAVRGHAVDPARRPFLDHRSPGVRPLLERGDRMNRARLGRILLVLAAAGDIALLWWLATLIGKVGAG